MYGLCLSGLFRLRQAYAGANDARDQRQEYERCRDHHRHFTDKANRNEVVHIEREIRLSLWEDCEGRRYCHEKGRAIRGGRGGGTRRDRATGTGLIDQHGLLAPYPAELVDDDPHGRIGGSARG